jgi:class 3 adenylate cyclase
MTATRRLAAIVAADVAGYSRLIGADEEGTLNRLKSFRADVIDPKITEHRGRIVKTTGDGLLVEFSSVVDPLRCATQWQHGWMSEMPMCHRSAEWGSDWSSTGQYRLIVLSKSPEEIQPYRSLATCSHETPRRDAS